MDMSNRNCDLIGYLLHLLRKNFLLAELTNVNASRFDRGLSGFFFFFNQTHLRTALIFSRIVLSLHYEHVFILKI